MPEKALVPDRVLMSETPVGAAATVHATCVLIGETGILIRGEAGTGKSTLARQLIQDARRQGLFATLVSDDRTRIAARHGRLVGEVVESIAGRMEVRGVGIVPVAHERKALVRLVVDLSANEPGRLPEAADQTLVLCGVVVPRLSQKNGATLSALILSRCVGDTGMTL